MSAGVALVTKSEKTAAISSGLSVSNVDWNNNWVKTKPFAFSMYEQVLFQCSELEREVGDDQVNQLLQSNQQATTSSSLLYDPREIGLQMVIPVLVWCKTHNIQKALDSASTPDSIFPGNLARILSRLLNLIDQLTQAATSCGNEELIEKLKSVEGVVKHGTLFESSLHLKDLTEQELVRKGVITRDSSSKL